MRVIRPGLDLPGKCQEITTISLQLKANTIGSGGQSAGPQAKSNDEPESVKPGSPTGTEVPFPTPYITVFKTGYTDLRHSTPSVYPEGGGHSTQAGDSRMPGTKHSVKPFSA